MNVAAYDAYKTRKNIRENGDLIEVPLDESPSVDGTVFDPFPAFVTHHPGIRIGFEPSLPNLNIYSLF